MWIKRFFQVLVLILALAFIGGCGGSNQTSTKTGKSAITKLISGYVIDDPVVGATVEVYDEGACQENCV